MPTKSEIVSEQLGEIRQDLRDLWTALRHDPKKQKRKEQMWSIFSGAHQRRRQSRCASWRRSCGPA